MLCTDIRLVLMLLFADVLYTAADPEICFFFGTEHFIDVRRWPKKWSIGRTIIQAPADWGFGERRKFPSEPQTIFEHFIPNFKRFYACFIRLHRGS